VAESAIKRTITYDVDLFCWEDDPADVEMFRWSAEGGISGERLGVECTRLRLLFGHD
jgi:hypothetical protein